MSNIFEINFFKFIKETALITPGDKILLAYSGGLDSSCLLYLLFKFRDALNVKTEAFYLNHGIRKDDELNAEIELIKNNCAAYNTPLTIAAADIKKIAREDKLCVEDAARRTRYNLLSRAALESGCNKIATAHHLDDSAETVILKLIKGASPSASGGIAAAYKNIIRPLMFAARNEIEKYSAGIGLIHSTDSTNFDTGYERNFVRAKIMPLIKELNPAFSSAVSNFHNIQKEENNLIDSMVFTFHQKHSKAGGEDSCPAFSVPAPEFNGLHTAVKRRYILHIFRLLNNDGGRISYDAVRMALDFIENNRRDEYIEIIKNRLYISRRASFDPARKYAASSKTIIFSAAKPDTRFGAQELKTIKIYADCDETLSCGGFYYRFTLGAAKPGNLCDANCAPGSAFHFLLPPETALPLVIRPFSPGDKIKPFGMKGKTQKLSDIFINEKIYGPLKKYIPVICGADGEIIAVCNIKISLYAAPFKKDCAPAEGGYLFSAFSKEIL
jgi:tRNA(Ile)-lysidine synthase